MEMFIYRLLSVEEIIAFLKGDKICNDRYRCIFFWPEIITGYGKDDEEKPRRFEWAAEGYPFFEFWRGDLVYDFFAKFKVKKTQTRKFYNNFSRYGYLKISEIITTSYDLNDLELVSLEPSANPLAYYFDNWPLDCYFYNRGFYPSTINEFKAKNGVDYTKLENLESYLDRKQETIQSLESYKNRCQEPKRKKENRKMKVAYKNAASDCVNLLKKTRLKEVRLDTSEMLTEYTKFKASYTIFNLDDAPDGYFYCPYGDNDNPSVIMEGYQNTNGDLVILRLFSKNPLCKKWFANHNSKRIVLV